MEHVTVADVACGSGQATIDLKNYFETVIGIEPSKSQLDNAVQHDRIKYIHATAEDTTLPDHSVDIVTVATAFHYFDFDKFFVETKRILKPKGTIAIWMYYMTKLENPDAQSALVQLMDKDLADYWSERINIIRDHYSHVQFSFSDIEKSIVYSERSMTLRNYINFLSTASGVQEYNKKNPNNTLLQDFETKLMNIYGIRDANEESIKVVWPIYLYLMRNC